MEISTTDGSLTIHNFGIFSVHEESYIWDILISKGIKAFEFFVENHLTTATLRAIIYFYMYNKWLFDIKIAGVQNPYKFLNLPAPYIDTFGNIDDNNTDSDYHSDDYWIPTGNPRRFYTDN